VCISLVASVFEDDLKQALAEFYAAIADRILPHITRRLGARSDRTPIDQTWPLHRDGSPSRAGSQCTVVPPAVSFRARLSRAPFRQNAPRGCR
jgi:hypothetical protein